MNEPRRRYGGKLSKKEAPGKPVFPGRQSKPKGSNEHDDPHSHSKKKFGDHDRPKDRSNSRKEGSRFNKNEDSVSFKDSKNSHNNQQKNSGYNSEKPDIHNKRHTENKKTFANRSEKKVDQSQAEISKRNAEIPNDNYPQEVSYEFGLMAATATGDFSDIDTQGLARSGNFLRKPRFEEMSLLPDGAVLQFLPDRLPITGELTEIIPAKSSSVVEDYLSVNIDQTDKLLIHGKLRPLAALLPSGWTRTLLPAWKRLDVAEDLPMFGYTAVFHKDGELWCAAVQTENNDRWNPKYYGKKDLPKKIQQLREKFPNNRLIDQLEICALEYGCYNAQNIFYGRWEGAAPVSPSCNAGCRGCISYQPKSAPVSPQIRLDFVPTSDEIAQLGINHLKNPQAIYSFGQGCEGEPLVQGHIIAQAIEQIRANTQEGSIHMNTNGSLTKNAAEVFAAGLDSVRVSLNSVIEETYNEYYQPQGYSFKNVVETIKLAKEHGLWVSLNLLLFPGINDTEKEIHALIDFVNEHHIDMIQMRTLNIDPDYLFTQVKAPTEPSLGIATMIAIINSQAPSVKIGNHNPYVPKRDKTN